MKNQNSDIILSCHILYLVNIIKITRLLTMHPTTPLVRTDKYFVSFSTCNPTLDQACSHWLTQSYLLTHSLFLLFLAQHNKLVTTSHEQGAVIIEAG